MPTTSKLYDHGRGPLLVIGGAEDPDEDDMLILPHFVKMAGGDKARIFVCGTSTTHPESTLPAYKRVFEKLGAAEVMSYVLDTRVEGNRPQAVKAVDDATAVFFTGGDQLRLTSLLSGTEVADRIYARFREGMPVAGTSAGAAAVAGTMIIGGRGSIVCRDCVDLAPGLGLWPETIVDTHFNREGRVHRIMAAIAQNPGVLGVGIDENTAIEIHSGGRATIMGSGNVFIFDGRMQHTNAPDVEDEEPLALTYSTLHVLAPGYGFDLVELEPIVPKAREKGRA